MTDDIILKIFMLSDEGRKNKHVAAELGLADTTVSKVLHGNHPLIERGGK
jgi:predicted transcriptional regulator